MSCQHRYGNITEIVMQKKEMKEYYEGDEIVVLHTCQPKKFKLIHNGSELLCELRIGDVDINQNGSIDSPTSISLSMEGHRLMEIPVKYGAFRGLGELYPTDQKPIKSKRKEIKMFE